MQPRYSLAIVIERERDNMEFSPSRLMEGRRLEGITTHVMNSKGHSQPVRREINRLKQSYTFVIEHNSSLPSASQPTSRTECRTDKLQLTARHWGDLAITDGEGTSGEESTRSQPREGTSSVGGIAKVQMRVARQTRKRDRRMQTLRLLRSSPGNETSSEGSNHQPDIIVHDKDNQRTYTGRRGNMIRSRKLVVEDDDAQE